MVTFAQSFHWMDQRRVASVVREMLVPGGAWVHVNATTHRGTGDASEPPHDRIERLVIDYLGPLRRAGRGIRREGTEREGRGGDGRGRVFRPDTAPSPGTPARSDRGRGRRSRVLTFLVGAASVRRPPRRVRECVAHGLARGFAGGPLQRAGTADRARRLEALTLRPTPARTDRRPQARAEVDRRERAGEERPEDDDELERAESAVAADLLLRSRASTRRRGNGLEPGNGRRGTGLVRDPTRAPVSHQAESEQDRRHQDERDPDGLLAARPRPRDGDEDDAHEPAEQRDRERDHRCQLEPSRGPCARTRGCRDVLGRAEPLEHVADRDLVGGARLEQRVVDVLADLGDELGPPRACQRGPGPLEPPQIVDDERVRVNGGHVPSSMSSGSTPSRNRVHSSASRRAHAARVGELVVPARRPGLGLTPERRHEPVAPQPREQRIDRALARDEPIDLGEAGRARSRSARHRARARARSTRRCRGEAARAGSVSRPVPCTAWYLADARQERSTDRAGAVAIQRRRRGGGSDAPRPRRPESTSNRFRSASARCGTPIFSAFADLRARVGADEHTRRLFRDVVRDLGAERRERRRRLLAREGLERARDHVLAARERPLDRSPPRPPRTAGRARAAPRRACGWPSRTTRRSPPRGRARSPTSWISSWLASSSLSTSPKCRARLRAVTQPTSGRLSPKRTRENGCRFESSIAATAFRAEISPYPSSCSSCEAVSR